jgi:hypothetical protein
VRFITIGVVSLLIAILVGAALVAAWPIILIGALIVGLSKGSDMWRDRARRMRRDDRSPSRRPLSQGSIGDGSQVIVAAST